MYAKSGIFCIWAATLRLALAMFFAGTTPRPVKAQTAAAQYVTAVAANVTSHLRAYGQVMPIATLPVSAAESGIVTGLTAIPGEHVRAGQELAHLTGPEIELSLRQGQAGLRSAQAQLEAARKYLNIEREQLPSHLSTRATVQQAESAVAQAQTNFDNARSHLEAVRQMMTLSAPAPGIVLTLNASAGQLVSAGQPVVTLQTTQGLWLEAMYYGSEMSRIHVGMRGVFSPSDGSGRTEVRVRAISGSMTAAGGEMIGLDPITASARWVSGEFGSVTLDLPPRKLVAVPTRSLILDQGKWWVVVHTGSGDHAQQVMPGPRRGWQTFLESGLKAGSQVVVENAYLLFHRSIGAQYQPPDE
jgi:cobalt-zinc-cadmium efflux system membrane fusion protein